jgi:glucose-6-phosphate isomerase
LLQASDEVKEMTMINGKPLGELPFALPFDLKTGASSAKPTQRRLSQMKGMYADDMALSKSVASGDPLVYEFYELGMQEHAGDLAFGTSIVFPGKVGDEYFMTKGHFHTILETAEVYYCLSGRGILLMETPEGDVKAEEMVPGSAVYVPTRYAHRSINTGNENLVMFFVFRADAGHNYGEIERKGFRRLVLEKNGKPEIVPNPKWIG